MTTNLTFKQYQIPILSLYTFLFLLPSLKTIWSHSQLKTLGLYLSPQIFRASPAIACLVDQQHLTENVVFRLGSTRSKERAFGLFFLDVIDHQQRTISSLAGAHILGRKVIERLLEPSDLRLRINISDWIKSHSKAYKRRSFEEDSFVSPFFIVSSSQAHDQTANMRSTLFLTVLSSLMVTKTLGYLNYPGVWCATPGDDNCNTVDVQSTAAMCVQCEGTVNAFQTCDRGFPCCE